MEKRRLLINAGFSLFPVLLSVFYYVIVSASRIETVPAPTELGSKVLAYLLAFPNTEIINLGDVRILFLLIALAYLVNAVISYQKAKGEKEKEAQLLMTALSFIAFLGILFSPIIVRTLFSVLSTVEESARANLIDLLGRLKDEIVFIVPMTALTLLRYFFLVLLSLLIPLALVLYPPKTTRDIGKIILEQAFIWTLSSVAALAMLTVVDAFAAIPEPAEQIPTGIIAYASAGIVVVSAPITLKILEMLEKVIDLLWKAIICEYKETYGKNTEE